MASFETHLKKYQLFKKDAENETVSHMSRVEAYFMASFHLIEAVMAEKGEHINKHTVLRSVLTKKNPFGNGTDKVWRDFQTIENQIRPGQEYGGKINGEQLKRARMLFEGIRRICLKWSKKNLES